MRNFAKHVTTVVIGAVALLVLSACSVTIGNPGPGQPEHREPQDHYRIAYIARAQVDSFAAWMANEMKQEAEKYDDVTLDVFDGQADDAIENTMIENAIANKYDAIIIQSNNEEAQRPYIEQAVRSGLVTVTTNPKVSGIDGASSVDSQPYNQGKAVAEYALEKIPQGAKVVVLDGPAGNYHSDQRRKAWQEVFFDQRPDVQIVAENIANWNKDEGMKLMEDWSLANPSIDAIVSMNDNMATGALEAVKSKPGFDSILSFGIDGTPEASMLIEEGKMTATVLQDAQELAKLNLEYVHKLLEGEVKNVDEEISNPLITPSNAKEFVQMYKEAGLIR